MLQEKVIEEFKLLHSDRARFDIIIGKISGLIYSYKTLSTTPNDILQECFLRMISGKRKINTEYDFDAIVMFISKSIIMDYNRKKSRLQKIEVSIDEEENGEILEKISFKSGEELDAEVEKSRQEEIDKKFEFLHSEMPDDTEALVVLEARRDGLSNKKIAKEYGMSVKDVEKALNRLRTKAKKYIERQ